MNYYKQQHELYCGIDLHAKRMYACVVDHLGEIQFHQNLKTARTGPEGSLRPVPGSQFRSRCRIDLQLVLAGRHLPGCTRPIRPRTRPRNAGHPRQQD